MSKHKKVKAVRLFSNTDYLEINPHICDRDDKRYWPFPVFVLPADAASYDAMVFRDACVIHGARIGMKDPQKSKHFCGNDATCAEAALKAKGINRPKETKA